MASSVIMPKTGMAMEEGKIIRWMKKAGDPVAKGEPIAEIETDKTTMELEAEADGTLLAILHGDGETIPVSRVIAWIGKQGEAIPAEAAPTAAAPERHADAPASYSVAKSSAFEGKIAATPAARRIAAERKIDLASIHPSGSRGEIRERDVLSANAADAGRAAASPLARKIAEERGIDLSMVAGTGPGGRVMKGDLDRELAIFDRSRTVPPVAAEGDTRVPLSMIQRVTGKRMLQSHLEAPSVTCQAKADVTELLALRERINAREGAVIKVSINDLVLKAVARALVAHPRVNSVLDGNEVVYRKAINIGVAVATPHGLVVPVLRGADGLALTEIAARSRELATRARDRKLAPEDFDGGTFTVSNIGMYGITAFTPIINPPQAAILGVCAIEEELKLIGGEERKVALEERKVALEERKVALEERKVALEVAVRKVMGLSLTFDHRVLDGVEAALFLKGVKEMLENPLLSLI